MSLRKQLSLRLGTAPRPTAFITGMPKSGTTAILRLMGLASGVSATNDPFHELDRAGVEYREALYGGTVSVRDLMSSYRRLFQGALVKDPNFVFFVDEMSGQYPDAHWIFTIRDPRDNIRSILNRLKLPGTAQAIERQLDTVPTTWRRVLDGRSPNIEGADVIERLSRRWLRMAEIMIAAGDRARISRYEDFMRAKEEQVGVLCRGVGLEPQNSIAEHVDTQFQPKGDRTAVWSEFYGADELATIESVCSAMLDRFGYTVR